VEGLKRPVGDLPPEVYWRRRLVAGAFAVLALLVLYYLVRSLFASGDGTEAAPSTSTSTTVSSTATVDVASTPGSTVDLSSVRACGAADVTIILTATTHDWAGSTEPTFDGTVSQVASTPCVLDTSDEKAELLVTSGNVRQWSNLDCDSGALLAPKEILLDPGETAVVSVTWPRVRSADGCPTGLPAPGPGTYRATLTVQGIESDQAVFALRN
jgi:hypothetical protein